MAQLVLTLNCGSSSIKFALFERAADLSRLAHGKIDGIGEAARFTAYDGAGKPLLIQSWAGGAYDDLIARLIGWIDAHLSGHQLAVVGHRIVHGADQFVTPCILSSSVLEDLRKLEVLAPLHQPHNLAAVDAVARERPGLTQVGCFDTAFHQSMSPTARRFGLPRNLEDAGLRRYGFHGISYEFIARRLQMLAPESADGRILVAHLGSGASMCAMRGGRSVDTSMGFSALDGLVMATRCGSLDPGVLLHLMRQGMDAARLEHLLYSQSGLLGLSGLSGDMRTLLDSSDPRAVEAVGTFVFRAVREAGALVSTMAGLDGIVFTAGIGENSPEIRRRICEGLAWLGVALDPAANAQNAEVIQAASSPVRVWVLPTDEERVIAEHSFAFL